MVGKAVRKDRRSAQLAFKVVLRILSRMSICKRMALMHASDKE